MMVVYAHNSAEQPLLYKRWKANEIKVIKPAAAITPEHQSQGLGKTALGHHLFSCGTAGKESHAMATS
jgi:hypothetical protein